MTDIEMIENLQKELTRVKWENSKLKKKNELLKNDNLNLSKQVEYYKKESFGLQTTNQELKRSLDKYRGSITFCNK